jgi:hypothetical protein
MILLDAIFASEIKEIIQAKKPELLETPIY